MDVKMESLKNDIEELKALIDKATRPKIKDLLSISLRKLETEFLDLKDATVKDEQQKPSTTPTSATTHAKRAPAYDVQIKNYSWDQSDKFVKLYLFNLKDVQSLDAEKNIKATFTEKSVTFKISHLHGKNHNFFIRETCEKINPEKSYYKVKSHDTVLIFLIKHTPGTHWANLTKAQKDAENAKASKLAKQDDDDPQASLIKMMKNIYDEGDDEMKRNIAKAWTEGQSKRGAEDF